MVFFWAMLILIGMVLADFYLPMLPSATLVTAMVGLVFGNPLLVGVLLVGAAGSSWLGEFLGYRVFRAIRAGLRRRAPRAVAGPADRVVRRTVVKLEGLLQRTIVDHPYRTTMVARFLPAGRTTLAWIAAGATRAPYARMAALGGALWAVYTVGLGLLIVWIAGPGWESMIGSVVTVLAVGVVLGWFAKRWQRNRVAEDAAAAAEAPASGLLESAATAEAAPEAAPAAAETGAGDGPDETRAV
ncbi:VTT domain-containing protein [Glycomyces sp. A-F 0318]|uniref:DedA family protein n=1 Tax=Glycomyces amatae TaxID=2881355 RepID=UPI001E408F74|nr:VTT domain-containing protein [Glycomyces amatae]MCD0442847.1 VTT domain-containing protein [Glycomyces amatae]